MPRSQYTICPCLPSRGDTGQMSGWCFRVHHNGTFYDSNSAASSANSDAAETHQVDFPPCRPPLWIISLSVKAPKSINQWPLQISGLRQNEITQLHTLILTSSQRRRLMHQLHTYSQDSTETALEASLSDSPYLRTTYFTFCKRTRGDVWDSFPHIPSLSHNPSFRALSLQLPLPVLLLSCTFELFPP